jgi:hypothetical protein
MNVGYIIGWISPLLVMPNTIKNAAAELPALLRQIPHLPYKPVVPSGPQKQAVPLGAPNMYFIAARLSADLSTAGLDLHVPIVLHRKAVFYNSCIFVEGIGRQVQIPA